MKKIFLDSKDREQFMGLVDQANEQLKESAENGKPPMTASVNFPSSDPASCFVTFGDQRQNGGVSMHTDLRFSKYKIPNGFFGSKVRWQLKAEIRLQGKKTEGYIISKLPVSAWQEALNIMAAMKSGKDYALLTYHQARGALSTY